MNLLHRIFNKNTYIQFFFSYLILLTVLMLGCLFIIKQQLSMRYFDLQNEQAIHQLNNISTQINNELLYLSQVDTAIKTNVSIIPSLYKDSSATSYKIDKELEKYSSTTKLIDSIIYLPKATNKPITTEYLAEYQDETFFITEHVGITWEFCPTPYLNASKGQLISVPCGAARRLVYFPSIKENASYIFFYVIDTTDILNLLNTICTNELFAIAILDSQKQSVASIHYDQILPYLDAIRLENGIYQLNHSTTLCVDNELLNNFSIIALSSDDLLMEQLHQAFAASYLTLMGLGILGLLIIHFSMKITYMPLHKLIHKVVQEPDKRRNYFEQLESTYSEAETQQQFLAEKLQHYRLSLKKSLLDDIICPQYANNEANLSTIDQLFDSETSNVLFILKMSSFHGRLPCDNIQKNLNEMLPGNDACFVLESTANSATFLINYTGIEPYKDEVLLEILTKYHQEQGFLSALSESSMSPMDIPSLFETASRASLSWPNVPVATATTLEVYSDTFTYPYSELEQFSGYLREYDFSAARSTLQKLFAMADQSISGESNIPGFFVRCILIDLITAIINCMVRANIRFKNYNDVYFETLYFSRSFPYAEKAEEIKANILTLTALYEQEIQSKHINASHIMELIEEYCYQPDFSITVLADKFQVSIAYMSYLIKKELNINFSEYLWTLRFQKAQELLRFSDMSIDNISKAIGYYNTSSFCRKFKTESGMTPSQFRSLNAKEK